MCVCVFGLGVGVGVSVWGVGGGAWWLICVCRAKQVVPRLIIISPRCVEVFAALACLLLLAFSLVSAYFTSLA